MVFWAKLYTFCTKSKMTIFGITIQSGKIGSLNFVERKKKHGSKTNKKGIRGLWMWSAIGWPMMAIHWSKCCQWKWICLLLVSRSVIIWQHREYYPASQPNLVQKRRSKMADLFWLQLFKLISLVSCGTSWNYVKLCDLCQQIWLFLGLGP